VTENETFMKRFLFRLRKVITMTSYESVFKSFRTESITKYTLTTINTG